MHFYNNPLIILALFLFMSDNSFSQERGLSSYSTDQEISITVQDSVVLQGDFVFGGANKLAILIAGSGPTDRNCNNHMGLKTDAFRLISDSLKFHGISSYRYDKRGIAASTKVPESTMSMQDFIDDASTIVNYFSEDFDEIYLIGHSEGALIGSVVSHENHNVQAFIALCGTSTSLDEIVLEQLAKYPKLHELAVVHIDEIKTGKPLSEVNPLLISLFRESIVPFLRSAFVMDPLKEMSSIEKDVLIVGGSCDRQVSMEHAELLHGANLNSELVRIDQMGHTLKMVGPDCKNDFASYSDPALPIHPELIQSIVGFIQAK